MNLIKYFTKVKKLKNVHKLQKLNICDGKLIKLKKLNSYNRVMKLKIWTKKPGGCVDGWVGVIAVLRIFLQQTKSFNFLAAVLLQNVRVHFWVHFWAYFSLFFMQIIKTY